MAKKNNTKKTVKINPEQKKMLAAAQAAAVEKTDETIAANENEVVTETVQTARGDDVTVTGNATSAEATNVPIKDNRTQKERRADRLALRDKALAEALEQNLPFFEGYPAAKFEEDYAKAFNDATTCEKAIPADQIRAAKAEVAASIEAAANKTPTQELIDAAKASQLPQAEMDNTETLSKDAADLALMQEADKLDKSPVAVVAEGQVTLVSNDGEIVGEKEIGETTTVTYEGVEYTLDAKGELVQLDGESGKKYGQRKHKFKGAKYRADKAVKDAAKAEQAEAASVVEFEGRNGSPPSPSDINKTLPLDVDDNGDAITAVVTPPEKSAEESATVFEEETKVDEALVEHGSFAATAEAEKANNESATVAPSEEQPEQSETTDIPASTDNNPDGGTVEPTNEPAPVDQQQEPAEQTSPPMVDEVKASTPAPKPKQTPKLVVDNEKSAAEDKKLAEKQTEADRAAAKKFYGSTWSDDKAIKLTQAHIWLTRATEADRKLRDKVEFEGPINMRTKFRMAMNAALKFEAEALGSTPQQITVEEITSFFGPAPQSAKAA